ncbi:biofilm PGA synthesis protein PgaB [Haloferula helveola]|uniref:Biofilm PGA synthesis protein PgaB n=1 Tax=Haloferula helveola TaxID=490095 RepID=A0ABM7REZ7_9BACT|nr:biofilm PGA synthesis protein PgaB [Haloferula helveola]
MMRSCVTISAALLFIACSGFGADAPAIRVAVLQGEGVGQSSAKVVATMRNAKDGGFQVSRITAKEIREGKLGEVDVLIHPGGSGGKQAKSLGKSGRESVRAFVREGGGFLGICAGAYLATNDYDWSLHLIDAKVVDRRHWARGKGEVTLRLSPEGASFFENDGDVLKIFYAQGPLLSRREWDDPEVPNYESLAVFSSEIAKNGAPEGVMAGTSAAVRCNFERGRVFCFSPHPELTEGLDHLIPLAVRWTAGQDD